jgi:type VI secretion system secreted protein VgrG
MAGLYTAIVIGPSGEEIYTDDLGRIQLWFPWDTKSEIKASSTFWARVVQPWAGANWGTQFIPRVGMEVAVAFLEGDVNRPVVVGSMYNANAAPVFAPADKNKSGIRTRSTKQGGTANFSEFSIDDTKGSELYFQHAEKDFTTEIEHDQSLSVGNNRTVTVTKDENVTIDGKQSVTVKQDQSLTVSQGNQTIEVSQGNRTIKTDQGNVAETVGRGNHSLTLNTGDQSVTLDTGNITVTVSAGSISYSAMQNITFKVGENSLSISPSGITLNGMQIGLTATASAQVSGATVSISGQGEVSVSAPAIMIG